MNFRFRSVVLVAAVALGALVQADATSAQVLYDSGGFESPRFVPLTDLNGQDVANGQWRRDQFTEGTAIVQPLVGNPGNAVQLTRPADEFGDTRYAIPLSPRITPSGAQNIVRVSWDMNVTQSPTEPFGPFFGVEGYDEPVAGDIRLAGSLGVDSRSGEILYQDASGFITVVEGALVPFGQWNRYAIEFDYTTQQYSGFLNGARLVTSPFVDAGITGMTDAPISTFATDPDALATSIGTALFDNYTIEVVPEPSALGLAGLASIALLRRRIRR